MLRLDNVTVTYGKHEALHGVSLEVEAGRTTVILGANGAGKTTLLKTIAGLMRPQPGGSIRFEGHAIETEPPHRMVANGIALVPEGRRLFGQMTVIDNLRMGAYAKHARAAEARRLQGVLAMFPRLAERRGQLASTMSGGEQQMVAIARALMSGPKLLLLDEPSLGLSPLLVKDLFATLHRIKAQGQSVILVEQSARQSLRLADFVYVLENGRIVRSGRPAEIEADEAIQKAYLGLVARRPAVPARVAAGAGEAGYAGPRAAGGPAPGGAYSVSHKEEPSMEHPPIYRRMRPAAEAGFFHPFARSVVPQTTAPAQGTAAPVRTVQAAAVPRLAIPTTGGFVNPQARRVV
jgi:branched-chain amino acid transport system ATP-binding protein